MRTRSAPVSLEGTLEIIDLSHASAEEAARLVLQEIRARRERRPHGANGPAVMIDLEHLGGSPGARRRDPGAEPSASPRRDGAAGGGGPAGTPFSFAELGEALRRMAEEAGGEPEPDETPESAPASRRREEREEIEEIVSERTLIIEDDGFGKMVTAAAVGFGLGAAAMYVARRFRYVAPPSTRRERPRPPHPCTGDDAAWLAQFEEFERTYGDGSGEEQEDEEGSPLG